MANLAQQLAAATARLDDILRNGRISAGFEVGADQGLIREHHIKVCPSMERPFAVRITSWAPYWSVINQLPAAQAPPSVDWPQSNGVDDTVAAHIGNLPEGWVTGGTILLHEGKISYRNVAAFYPASEFRQDPPTVASIRDFYTLNAGDQVNGITKAENQYWPHAARWLTVVAGWATNPKHVEVAEVANPTAQHADSLAAATEIIGGLESAATCLAAGCVSWRRSNHRTGGRIATGMPQKFLQKEGRWSQTSGAGVDRAAAAANNQEATDLFYYAAHGSSVHGILAAMVPEDEDHYSYCDPKYGFLQNWDIRESIRIRIAPKTQVAGTALIVDSVTVMALVVTDQLSPLLSHIDQLGPLIGKYDEVVRRGMRVGVYKAWFFSEHPTDTTVYAFNQKDASCHGLVEECAMVATKLYAQTTIGKSPSLKNAADQSSDIAARDLWTSLAATRQTAAQDRIIRAVRIIKGATTLAAVEGITSDDDTEVDTGVDQYNQALSDHAHALGLTAPRTISKTDVITQRDRLAAEDAARK